jgi:hypothetical protein
VNFKKALIASALAAGGALSLGISLFYSFRHSVYNIFYGIISQTKQ